VNGPAGTTPAQWADQAGEAVRALNHATIWADDARGYQFPADVDATLANLQVLIDRLPQALEQMGRWLDREASAGRVGYDDLRDGDGYPVQAPREEAAAWGATTVRDRLIPALDAAAASLDVVGAELARARAYSSHLTAFGENPPDDQPDDQPDGQAGPATGGDGAR